MHAASAMRRTVLIALLVVAGCSGKPDLSDEPIDVAADLKSDLWKSTRFLGNFAVDGRAQKGIAYHNAPKYRSFSFGAVAGTVVDVRVTSDGDAVAWLFDSSGKLIKFNDDSDGGANAHIRTKLPASNGFYYVYFREYSLADATFGFSLSSVAVKSPITDAENAWEAATATADGPASFLTDRAHLPAGARARFDVTYPQMPSATISAYALPTASGGTVYAVYGFVDEYAWLDLFASDGKFLVHGECGDGGFAVTAWGGAQGPLYYNN